MLYLFAVVYGLAHGGFFTVISPIVAELFGIGSSWGGFESLMIRTHPTGTRTATTWTAPGPSFRIHAGLEDPDDLIADLDAGFARLARTAREEAGEEAGEDE